MDFFYSDLVKRQESEMATLQYNRYQDIESLQQMGRPYEEVLRVHYKYQADIDALVAKHEKERSDYLKQGKQKYPDKNQKKPDLYRGKAKTLEPHKQSDLEGEKPSQNEPVQKDEHQKLRDELRESVAKGKSPVEKEQERREAELLKQHDIDIRVAEFRDLKAKERERNRTKGRDYDLDR